MNEKEILPGYNKLSSTEQSTLLEAPVVISILAALSDDGRVNLSETKEAERIAKVKSYNEIPYLMNYYQKVHEEFSSMREKISTELKGTLEDQKSLLKEKLSRLKDILPKLPEKHRKELLASIKDFAKYVFKSNSSVLEYFLLPLIMNELEKSIK